MDAPLRRIKFASYDIVARKVDAIVNAAKSAMRFAFAFRPVSRLILP